MRRNVEIGYPRGEETRTRILNIALGLFGTKGFDGVSTREIAAAASVPAPSLQYYFENKQGLYIACLEHLQLLALQAMEPALQKAERLLEARKADTDALIDAYCSIQEAMINHLIGGDDDGAMALFVLRHELPSEGDAGHFKSSNRTGALRMMNCLIKLVRQISGNTLDAQSALIVAGLINGQLTAIHVSRRRLAEGGWTITPERLRWLKRTIRKQTRAMLLAQRGK